MAKCPPQKPMKKQAEWNQPVLISPPHNPSWQPSPRPALRLPDGSTSRSAPRCWLCRPVRYCSTRSSCSTFAAATPASGSTTLAVLTASSGTTPRDDRRNKYKPSAAEWPGKTPAASPARAISRGNDALAFSPCGTCQRPITRIEVALSNNRRPATLCQRKATGVSLDLPASGRICELCFPCHFWRGSNAG